MQVKVCSDPALVTSRCLRVRTRRSERFVWREGWRLRYCRWEREL